MPEGDFLYVGIDESNHARFPEIYVSVMSNFCEDISRQKLSKKRRDHGNLFARLNKRRYSFLLFDEPMFKAFNKTNGIKERRFLATIIPNLLDKEKLMEYGNTDIYIDGEMPSLTQKYLRDAISEFCGVEKRKLSVIAGAHFDQIYPVVNMADEMAHYLFRHKSMEELLESPNIRYLVK